MDKILSNKSTVLNPITKVTQLDLTEATYEIGMENIPIKSFGYVLEQMISRPDLFSIFYTSNIDDQWSILKYNRLSNPFSLNIDMVLAVPNQVELNKMLYTTSKRDENNPNRKSVKNEIRKEVLDSLTPTKKENISSNTFDSFKRKYEQMSQEKEYTSLKDLQKGSAEDTKILLPPNFAQDDKKEITVNPNGTISLGTSVAESPTSCGKTNVSKAELLNSLVKNRIIK